MVYLAIFLMVIGCFFIVMEIFTPGFGVFGISGIIATVVSAVLTILYLPFGPFIVVGEFVILGAVVMFFIDYVRRKQLFGKIILDETLKMDEDAIGDLSYFLGKEGVTKTSLRPVGNVDFNGVVLEVYSDGGFILENTKVRVVEVKKHKIIVRAEN